MHIIGVDIGTTSVSTVAVDVISGTRRSSTVAGHAFLPAAHPFEKIQDVDTLAALARQGVDAYLDADTAAIGVTGQMHGIVYYNDRGKAVSPLFTWQDGRGDLPYGESTYAKTLNSYTGYGCVTDFYNRQNGLVPSDAVGFCTIGDYVVMQLCGLRRPLIHETDVASFGCYDLKRHCLTDGTDIKPVSGYRCAGSYKGVPVAVAIGDNQAAVLGSGVDTHTVLVNVGTGSQVSVISTDLLAGNGLETRPYFDGLYLTVGAALCGGRAYAVLMRFFKQAYSYVTDLDEAAVYGILGQMAQRSCETPLTVDTRFSGTRDDPALRGSVTGLSDRNFTPEQLTTGVLQGIIGELFDLYRRMGVTADRLVGSGNGMRQNVWLQQAAETMFGVPLHIPACREEAAFGAALYAAVAAGAATIHTIPALIRYE